MSKGSRRSIPVDRGWQLKGYLGEEAAVEAARSGYVGEAWLPAAVPGSVAWDLVAAGEAPNAGRMHRRRAGRFVSTAGTWISTCPEDGDRAGPIGCGQEDEVAREASDGLGSLISNPAPSIAGVSDSMGGVNMAPDTSASRSSSSRSLICAAATRW